MTKISGKVTEKIRRILVQNFSVENCISECRVSLKKCLLCASGAETDHPAGITRRVRAITKQGVAQRVKNKRDNFKFI